MDPPDAPRTYTCTSLTPAGTVKDCLAPVNEKACEPAANAVLDEPPPIEATRKVIVIIAGNTRRATRVGALSVITEPKSSCEIPCLRESDVVGQAGIEPATQGL